MKQHLFICTLTIILITACSNESTPDQPDFQIIPTNSTMDINGMIERNGEVSIFGANPEFTRYLSSVGISQCLQIEDFAFPIPHDNQMPLYSTLSADGRTWTENDQFVSNINDVLFLDDQTGYLQTRLQGLFKTTNGGNSWQQIMKANANFYCYGRIPLRFEQVYFKNEMEGYVVDGTGGSFDFILKTVDGGEHWDLLYPTEAEFMAGSSLSVRDVYFVPGSLVAYWKVGLHGGYYKSIDGGQSWDATGEETGAEDIQFVNADVGYYLQRGALYKTTDGGNSWTNTAPNLPYDSPYKLQDLNGPNRLTLINENTLYISGENSGNDVFRTSDGGETFERLKVPPGANFIRGIYQGPSGKVYAYGQQGLLMALK